MRLISRPRQNMLRRIYAVESVVVPAEHTTNVPVASSSLRQTPGDWAVEQRSLGIGIFAARTLMRDEGRRSDVQVMNVSKEDFVLSRGEFIGKPIKSQRQITRKRPGDRPRERMSSKKKRRFLPEDRWRNRTFPRTGMLSITRW